MNNMNSARETKNLSDAWALLFFYVAKRLVTSYGEEGEMVLREGIRAFGIDRGESLKERHRLLGIKLNLYNLFSYYDLPGDPRFKRRKIKLNSQERLSETLVCPMADLWNEMGGKSLGRIYCEEFHHAMFNAYAPKAQVNLSQTLTQDGDNHCRFSVYLRPANMDFDERKLAFEEFDLTHQPFSGIYDNGTPKNGFRILFVKLFGHIASVALEKLSPFEKIKEELGFSVSELAEEVLIRLKKDAIERNIPFNKEFIYENCPVAFSNDELANDIWKNFSQTIKELVDKRYIFYIEKYAI